MQSAADANTEESTVAVPPSKYPSDAQVIEMLRKKKADPAWGMFHIDKSRKGEVYCSFCKASIRGWENDVKKHMITQCHKMKAHGPMVQYIPLPGSKKRTATEVSAPSHDIFLAHTLIHAEASGISYYAARRFLSPPFLTALHKHGKDLPTSSQMRRKYFNPAVSIVQESVDELISDTPYTILVDETPERSQVSFVLISLCTISQFVALRCKVLAAGESINAQKLCDLILDTLSSRNLSLGHFIAYASDNCSYGKKAYKLLLTKVPNLQRIGCLSHVIHLLSKALFASDSDAPFFPLADEVLTHLNSLFASRQAAEDRARQERFSVAFHRSGRTLFWQVRGRWACKLTTLLWIADDSNAKQFMRFIDSEIETCARNVPESLTNLRQLLSRPLVRVQLELAASIGQVLSEFLTISQTDDVVVTAEMATKLDFMLLALKESGESDSYCEAIVRNMLNTNLVILSADKQAELAASLRNAMLSLYAKYLTHVSHLQYAFTLFRHIDPKDVFSNQDKVPFPAVLLPLSTRPIAAMGEYLALTAANGPVRTAWTRTDPKPSVQDFWITNRDKFPHLAAIAYKLLAMRAGISGVERQFKLLRDIQLPQRNRMLPATLEGLFLMRANAHVCDPYARTAVIAEERSEDEQE